MIRFLVRPVDWVAFGPPRPTSAGETHRRSTDLPAPTTFQGIVRTALLAASGDDFSDRSRSAQKARDALVGRAESLLPGWQLRGPFFTEIVQGPDGAIARPWLPAPRFLTETRREPGTRREPLVARPVRSPDVEGGPAALNDLSPTVQPVLLARPAEGAVEPLGGWLSPRGLRWALAGERGAGPWRRGDHAPALPPFVKRQELSGLEINPDTGTAEDGMLFFHEVLRFAPSSGLAGWLSAQLPPAIPEDALTRGDLASCGWRSRPAVLEALPALDMDFRHLLEGGHLPERVAEDQGFYLITLTPARCREQMSAVDAATRDLAEHVTLPDGVTARVLAALTGPPRVIGGLSAVSNAPRPNRSYWEAGSAWLFVLRGGGAGEQGETARARALRALPDVHTLGPRGEASFGYGHTLVGVGPLVDREILETADRRKEGRA